MIDLERSLFEQAHNQRRQTDHGPMAKTLADLVRYREIIRHHQPTVLVETGTWTGASAHWFGRQMDQALPRPGRGRGDGAPPAPVVVTVDVQEATIVQGHPYTLLCPRGDSTDPELVERIRGALVPEDRVMVVLDSDHQAEHVARELDLYAPLVTPGQYLVVEDTLCRWVVGWTGKGTPADALDAFWATPASEAFELDEELEDMMPDTQHPGGWLRRRAA